MSKELTASTILSSLTEPQKSRKSALVLGGGGARGYAHLGIAQVLVEAGLEPDLIVGTSMGAVTGSSIANRTDLQEMIEVLSRHDINNILEIPQNQRKQMGRVIGRYLVRKIPIWGRDEQEAENFPVQLKRLFSCFKSMTGDSNIENLPIDFAAVATNLEEGREFVIKSGKIYRTIAASAAIPGLIPPVKIDGQQFIDGGVVDTLPILPAMAMGATNVLAVDVGNTLSQPSRRNPFSSLYRSAQIRNQELTEMKKLIARIKLEDNLLVLKPAFEEIDWLNFNNVKEPVSIGRNLARDNLSNIKALFQQ